MIRSILIFIFGTLNSFGQTLSIASNSSIIVNSNSSISVDGLELAPSEAYIVSGPNTIDRSDTAIVVGENASINRVYELSAELSDYSGILNFKYLESELNSILEADLVLEVLDVNGSLDVCCMRVLMKPITR